MNVRCETATHNNKGQEAVHTSNWHNLMSVKETGRKHRKIPDISLLEQEQNKLLEGKITPNKTRKELILTSYESGTQSSKN